MAQGKRARPSAGRTNRIETKLVKSPSALSFHADGMWGGLTPKLEVAIGFFTEQFSPPDSVTYELPDPMPGELKEVARHGGGIIQRELQVQVFISVDVAKSMIVWLQDKVDTAAKVEEQVAERREIDGSDAAASVMLVPKQ